MALCSNEDTSWKYKTMLKRKIQLHKVNEIFNFLGPVCDSRQIRRLYSTRSDKTSYDKQDALKLSEK